MKRLLLFLTAAAALATVPSLRAELSPVSIRVELASKDQSEKFDKTQNKSLRIYVTNSSAQALEGLTAKYYFFGHDMKDHDPVILEQGEKAASVKAHGSEIVETGTVTVKSTEAHSEGGKYGKGGKKVEASGKKFTGYGVQVLDKGKVVAEFYSTPSLKEKVPGKKE